MSDQMQQTMQNHFGARLQENVRLSRYTTARVGGPARWFAVSSSAQQLAADVTFLWQQNVPFRVLGNGSNLLVSDHGWRGVILLNQAKEINFDETSDQPLMITESGATLSSAVRLTAERGFGGLEWAAGIPGTIGGAVYGNAGARGQDISQMLVLAEILHQEKGRCSLLCEQMGYSYRSSALKRSPGSAVILTAQLKLTRSTPAAVNAKIAEFNEKRRNSQPAGASLGSMFKNPAGDFAGRLIEAAGLKGTKIGGVEISPIHANFMINDGTASAEDYHQLIKLVQKTVAEKFAVMLETEIEILGEWQD